MGTHSAVDDPRNADLLAFVRTHLGTAVRIQDGSRAVGQLSVVWRATGAEGATWFAKRNETLRHFAREAHAYEAWVPRLRDVPGVRLPQVVARDDALGAFLFTALPGAGTVDAVSEIAEQATAHRLAGRFLQALHALPLPAPAPDVGAHMRALIGEYVLPHGGFFDQETFDWMVATLDEGRPFAGAPFVCAHRDCSPRNWILAPDGSLGVIDWERAQPDVWLADVTRMEFDTWPARPALRNAFFEGYGRPLDARVMRQIRLATLIHAAGSIAWAVPRGDTEFADLARAAVARLRAEL